jgi:hypothetical protein
VFDLLPFPPHAASASTRTSAASLNLIGASTHPHGIRAPVAKLCHTHDQGAGCTEDYEAKGCRGRELRHEGDPVRCWIWSLGGCNYCGVQ